jgi:Na+/H+ antiporter NhaD/arsenite permease-like protein
MTLPAIILLICVLAVFMAMARQKFGPAIGMPLLALVALCVAGPSDATNDLKSGFEDFARIAVIFTGVAIAAHKLKDSNGLKSVGMMAGQSVGLAALRLALPLRIMIPAICLGMTWMLAATLHNTTSILIMAEISYLVCEAFNVNPGPVLLGTLPASNLGGFSTRWGDTPNLVEASVWGLQAGDFIQILCINLGCLALLIAFVAALMEAPQLSRAEINVVMQNFVKARRETSINGRLVTATVFALIVVIVPAIFYPEMELRFVAVGILLLCLAAKLFGGKGRNGNPFDALGFETLCTLASVFVLASVLGSEHLGITSTLTSWLNSTGAPAWAIAGISYFGTLFTEAASWANAAAGMVHTIDDSHRSAWALGAGICAGSSSLLTSASAGILLMHQTARYSKGRVTFSSYLRFGLGFSIVMLVYYSVVLSLLYRH